MRNKKKQAVKKKSGEALYYFLIQYKVNYYKYTK